MKAAPPVFGGIMKGPGPILQLGAAPVGLLVALSLTPAHASGPQMPVAPGYSDNPWYALPVVATLYGALLTKVTVSR